MTLCGPGSLANQILEWNIINKKHKVTTNQANHEATIKVMTLHNKSCNNAQHQFVIIEHH